MAIGSSSGLCHCQIAMRKSAFSPDCEALGLRSTEAWRIFAKGVLSTIDRNTAKIEMFIIEGADKRPVDVYEPKVGEVNVHDTR